MKQLIFLFLSVFCVSFAANAQLTYNNGVVTLNTTQYRDYVSTWSGWAHAFKRVGVFKIMLHVADTRIGTDTNKLVIYNPDGIGFQDLHLRTLYQSSDARGKTNITSLSNSRSIMGGGAMNTVRRLNPVAYQFVDQAEYERYNVRPTRLGTQQEFGFLAQDVEQVLPNLVVTGADDKLLVNYVGLIPLLTAAIQELNARVEALERENATLKSR